MKEAPSILCQPGRGRGCSACCGLFNLKDISEPALREFLLGGLSRGSDPSYERDPEEFDISSFGVRDPYSHICPFQGFSGPDTPGCLCHSSFAGRDTRERSLFGRKICGSFYCPAHKLLSDKEKIFITDHTRGWYPYSIAVIDPGSTSWIISNIIEAADSAGGSPEDIQCEALNRALEIHGQYLNRYRGPVFYYSVSEYNLHRKAFSLDSGGEDRKQEREVIREAVEGVISSRKGSGRSGHPRCRTL